jgi:predicted small lipoprotein YifL
VKKQLSALFAAAALAALAACGSTPTAPRAAAPTRAHADEAPLPQDTTAQRVPNMMGSGN